MPLLFENGGGGGGELPEPEGGAVVEEFEPLFPRDEFLGTMQGCPAGYSTQVQLCATTLVQSCSGSVAGVPCCRCDPIAFAAPAPAGPAPVVPGAPGEEVPTNPLQPIIDLIGGIAGAATGQQFPLGALGSRVVATAEGRRSLLPLLLLVALGVAGYLWWRSRRKKE